MSSFQSILPPTTRAQKSRPSWSSKLQGLSFLLSNTFAFTTTLLLGCLLQTILILLPIPTTAALAPAVALLAYRFLDTMAITFKLRANPYLQDVIFNKTSAQIPDTAGNFPERASGEKIAILMLGAKSNHPLGVFAPNFSKVQGFIEEMTKQLNASKGAEGGNGFLGQSGYTKPDARGALEFCLISYWRSIDDLHAFAHGPLHREAWTWWDKTLKENDHLGINHEIYSAAEGQWENVYANFQPTGLGATSFLKKGDKLVGGIVPDEWISPLIQANKGQLRTSAGRLGWAPATQRDQY